MYFKYLQPLSQLFQISTYPVVEKKRPISNFYIPFLWKKRPISNFYTAACGNLATYFKFLHPFSVEKSDVFQISTYRVVEIWRPISNFYTDVFQISTSKTAIVEN